MYGPAPGPGLILLQSVQVIQVSCSEKSLKTSNLGQGFPSYHQGTSLGKARLMELQSPLARCLIFFFFFFFRATFAAYGGPQARG